MDWKSNQASIANTCFAELPTSVGKAGTTDSVAIISAIWFIARVVAK